MNFEWDAAKGRANKKKHGVDPRTATRVFLDPNVIEFGIVDGRMLFVACTVRGDVVRIISARGAEPHEKRKYREV